MKTLRLPLCLVVIASASFGQDVVAPPAPSAPPAAPQVTRSAEYLEQLLAPIALYPDALIALILPAAVSSTDIVLAARHLRDAPGDRSQIEHRAWDDSVKSLTSYPEVLLWMDENLPWTKAVGEAFSAQPAEVMQTVQRLRARARAAGTLVDTPQQQVVVAEPHVIRIVPAQPDVIYVPRYEPEILFIHEPVYYARPLLTFGVGVRAGSWLAYDCDWRRNTIWIGDRHRRWSGHDWRRPLVSSTPGFQPIGPTGVRQWRPPSTHHRGSSYTPPPHGGHIARPSPIGSPHPRSGGYPHAPATGPGSSSIISKLPPRTNSSHGTRTLSPTLSYASPAPAPSPVYDQPAQLVSPTASVPAGARRSVSDWSARRESPAPNLGATRSRRGPQPTFSSPAPNPTLSVPPPSAPAPAQAPNRELSQTPNQPGRPGTVPGSGTNPGRSWQHRGGVNNRN